MKQTPGLRFVLSTVCMNIHLYVRVCVCASETERKEDEDVV